MTEKEYEHSEEIHSLLKKLVDENKARRIERFDLQQGLIYSIVDPEVAVIERWFSPTRWPGYKSGMPAFLYIIGREEDIQKFEREYSLKRRIRFGDIF